MSEQGPNRKTRIREIESKLETLADERNRLITELTFLRASEPTEGDVPAMRGTMTIPMVPESSEDKVALFLKLFRARESVFPKLWENKAKGTKGYSPACNNEWVAGVCGKPQVKCSDCPNQAFSRLDEQAVRDHLQGRETIGTYAIRENDTCVFLTADFDGDGWKQDVLAYRAAARELGIQAEIERSRSGNGAHAWIFFSEPISARTARQLGTIIVARAHAARHTMRLDTYDRFFPNQDTLPKGGFGNLIALPLQRAPRDRGNSVFLNDHLEPAPDQWELLASARRLSPKDVQQILSSHLTANTFIIAMPVSFKGKLIQYAGRLHRASPGKTDAVIYDYLDASSALTVSMFRKRISAYRKMEYQIETPSGSRASRMSREQIDFFSLRG